MMACRRPAWKPDAEREFEDAARSRTAPPLDARASFSTLSVKSVESRLSLALRASAERRSERAMVV